MKIAILIVDEPIYLPRFMRTYFEERAADTVGVFCVRPTYGKETPREAALKYFRTFGLAPTLQLSARVVVQRFGDLLPGAKRRNHSIKSVCAGFGVPRETVRSVNAPDFLAHLRELGTDVVVSVGVPQIFKKELIELPKVACLNIHGAILPDYRGIMPSFWVLANGETKTGVSIFYIDAGIDTGDLVGQEVFDIPPGTSQHALLRRSKAVACGLLLKVLRELESGTAKRTKMDLAGGRYFKWPAREDVARLRSHGFRLW